MKYIALYLSSTSKIAEDKIIEQFNIVQKKENKLVSFIKNELLIKYCDVFILYLGSSVKECFKASILKESKVNVELQAAINCGKKILLAYSPAWNEKKDEYLFYETTMKIEPTGVIKVEGISGTSLCNSGFINIYSKESKVLKNNSNLCDEMPLYSEKSTEHQFEAHLLLETNRIFNEELLLIN